MNSGIKSLVNKIDYNTYMKICSYIPISNFTLATINILLLTNHPLLEIIINTGMFSSIVAQFYLNLSDIKLYTKDITEIRNLYNDFIKNYNQLNKDFKFNNPIQIYTMYNYLLYKGYLSKDKTFMFSKENVIDIKTIMGTNIINGQGVCRHISSLLTDILNDYGIFSTNISCYLRHRELDFNITKKPKYTKEETIQFINNNIHDENDKNILFEIMEYHENNGDYIELYYKYIPDKDLGKILYGNHLITYAEHNSNNYFLDPTQNRIYRLKDSKNNILFDKDVDNIKITSNSFYSDYKKFKKSISLNNFINEDEEGKLISDTLKICEDYINVFESFYKNNHELYEEIVDKLIKVKRI